MLTRTTLLDAAMDYAGRGLAVVPMVFDNGKKRCPVRWTKYQTLQPTGKTLGRWFEDGKYPALAVVLGAVSGHLACRDFDVEDAYRAWAEEFPDLAERLPTVRTGRGYHVYFTAKILKIQHYTDGELRGEKCLCCLPPSRHPAGQGYDWVVALPDGELPEIKPAESGLIGEPVQQKRTEENRCIQKQTDANRSNLSAGDEGESEAIKAAIQATLPTGPRKRNGQVFQLARALKGIPSLANKDPQSLIHIVQRWHSLALPYINTKEFDVTLIDFLYGWPRVHTPMRANLMEDAMKAAKVKPIPNLPYDTQYMRDLAALCRELQGIVGDGPFFLSTRTAGRLLGVDHTTAWRGLFFLEADGWIATVEKGGTATSPRKATRFRYTGKGRTVSPDGELL